MTFGGRFSYRDSGLIQNLTGYVIIDADHLSLHGAEPEELKALPARECGPSDVFVSPRGDGLKAVFSCEIPQTEDGLATCYKSMWRAAKERVIPVWLHIDESGSDVTRLCYLSGDPLYLVNANADSLAPSELLPVPPPKAPARSAPSLLTAVDLLALKYLVSVEWWWHGMGRDTDGLCLMGWARRHGFTYEWAVDTLKRGGTELPESYAYQR